MKSPKIIMMRNTIVLIFLCVLPMIPKKGYAGCDNKTAEQCKKEENDLNSAVSSAIGTLAVSSTAIGVGIWMSTREKDQKKSYFEENNKAIRKALALGGHDAAVEDLMKMFNISNKDRDLAIENLKQNRIEVLSYMDPAREKSELPLESIQAIIRR